MLAGLTPSTSLTGSISYCSSVASRCCGQREVQHDAGDGRVRVEVMDGLRERPGGDVVGESLEFIADPDGLARLFLPPGIDLPGRGGTDQNGGQLDAPPSCVQGSDALGYLLAGLGGECGAVDDPR